jgi:peptidoglycan hydrolase-like protein with peptidoglycan-binding domain
MFSLMSRSISARTAAAALVIGGIVAIGAHAAAPTHPQQQPTNGAVASAPVLPLGGDDVREVQNQLIALGFDPGPADGQVGPATRAAAQQYDQSRGGTGRVSIDGALLARLKSDTAPRLSYAQVAERSRERPQALSAATPSAPAGFGGIVQQFMPLIASAIANSNNDRYYGPSYGPGYYEPAPGYYYGRGYYAPPPRYYGYRGW